MKDFDIILAETPGLGRVRLCECDSVHLTIGPVTLHIEPQALAQTALMLRNAMKQLATVLEARDDSQNPLSALGAPPSKLTH